MTVSLGSGGALAGGVRWWVACSKANARAISRGSLKARPVNAIPNGAADHMDMPATPAKIWEACQKAMGK